MNGLKLLLWKNLKVQSRDRLTTAVEILLPALAALFFGLVHALIKVKEYPDPVVHPSFGLTDLPEVLRNQTSVLYYGPANPLTDSIMQIVDSKFFKAQGLNYTFRGADNMHDLIEEYTRERLEWNLNLTRGPILGAVYFDNLNWGFLPQEVKYTIKLPSRQRTDYAGLKDRGGIKGSWQTELNFPFIKTSGPRSKDSIQGGFPGYFDEGFLYLQYAVDNAIIEKLLARDDTKTREFAGMSVRLQRFPFPAYREDKFDFVVSMYATFIIGVTFAFPMMNLTRRIIQEKSSRLKEFLKIMGLRSWLHWTAWFVQSYVFLLLTVILLAIAAKVQILDGLCFLQYSNSAVVFVVLNALIVVVIGFSFLASVLFSTAEAGATAAGFVWISSSFVYLKFSIGYEQFSNLGKYSALGLGGPVPLGFFFLVVATFERQGVGLQWENLWDGATSKDDISVGMLIVVQLIWGVFYMLAAFYVELAFPGQFGVRLPWYFPFTKWFWTGSSPPSDVNTSMSRGATVKKGTFESDPIHLATGVELRGLTKAFGARVAVNNLKFKMYENQVTSLLGHNGAGKTTTMSMLTGLLRPSAGTAVVDGYDIRTDMRKIRSSLGLCPQNNILFDNLTVEEHLKFYCALKGMDKAESLDEIQRCLTLLGLENQRNTLARNLSAGTKRKLCVGMAFAANSKVVLLDEPTAGMDPLGRRSTWDIIQSEKYGRTVILSTHYMEEADLLGDRIAIMVNGQLQCAGSSVFLKQKYGKGFKLSIVKTDNANLENIKEIIRKSVPDVEFTHEVGQEIKCTLPVKGSRSFCPLFEDLDTSKEELGIIAYGVSPATMEEVFVRVGEEAEESSPASHSHWRRDEEVEFAERTTGTAGLGQSTRTLYRPTGEWNEGWRLWFQQLRAMIIKRTLMNVRKRSLLTLQLLMPPFFVIVVVYFTSGIPGMKQPRSRVISLEDYAHFGHPTIILSCDNSARTVCEAFKAAYNGSATFEEIRDSTPVNQYILQKTERSLWKVESDYLFAVQAAGNGTAEKKLVLYFNNQMFHLPPLALNILSNTLLNFLGTDSRISVTNHPFDYAAEEETFGFPGLAGVFYVGMALLAGGTFLWASLVISPTAERLAKFKDLQKIAGLRFPTFWLGEFLVCAVIVVISMVTMILVGSALVPLELGSWEAQWHCLLMGLVYGAAVIPVSMVISLVADNAASAYAKLLSGSLTLGAGSFFALIILRNKEFDLEDLADPFHQTALVLPPYALGSGVLRLGLNRNLYLACHKVNITAVCEMVPTSLCCSEYTENYFAWDGFGIGKNILYLSVVGVGSVLILILLEARVLQRLKLFSRSVFGLMDSTSSVRNGMELQDPDVNAERGRITHSALATLAFTDPLVLRNLTKVYNGKRVVDDLSFGSKTGEVFGLLGVNGSGKTTTFKMLTQATAITAGDAFISSYSVSRQTRKAHKHLGYCPQSDALILELTGRETLTIFARLKGINEKAIPELVADVAARLLFTKHLDKQIGNYSGGNKRKLSAAVAMLGYPEVIILDEPTAGIDPVAKCHVWEAVAAVRDAGTAVILASQDMDECEALCSRIGILADGKLQCIGTPQYLKSKLLVGYKLVVQLACSYSSNSNGSIPNEWDMQASWRTQKEEFCKLMNDRLPGCVLKEDHVGYLEYSLPEGATCSQIFAAMEDASFASQIEGFCVSQADLQQVFFKYGQTGAR